MHPRHTPRPNMERGLTLVFYCRCGRPAYQDVASGKSAHADRLPERTVGDRSIAGALDGLTSERGSATVRKSTPTIRGT